MRYFYYPHQDKFIELESAVVPKLNGEDAQEITFSEYSAHLLRINADMLKIYEEAAAEQRRQAEELLERRRAIYKRLGVTEEEMKVLEA